MALSEFLIREISAWCCATRTRVRDAVSATGVSKSAICVERLRDLWLRDAWQAGKQLSPFASQFKHLKILAAFDRSPLAAVGRDDRVHRAGVLDGWHRWTPCGCCCWGEAFARGGRWDELPPSGSRQSTPAGTERASAASHGRGPLGDRQ